MTMKQTKTGLFTRRFLDYGDVVTRKSKVEIIRESEMTYRVLFLTGPNRGTEKSVKKSKVELIEGGI